MEGKRDDWRIVALITVLGDAIMFRSMPQFMQKGGYSGVFEHAFTSCRAPYFAKPNPQFWDRHRIF